ncbi:MAG: DUF2958 domain-containing protein [Ilumatobacteraceae bacterium]
MELLTESQRAQLIANGKRLHDAMQTDPEAVIDFRPVVKLFTPDAGCTWLLTEIDPDDTDRAFGLCDLGMGYPELGYVSLEELASVRGKLGLPIERDLHFAPAKPISAYVNEARALGRISA